MADEVEITKNSLDVLSEDSELASKFTAVSKILGIADKLTSAFPFVGAVLGLVDHVLPDSKHTEILHSFEKLSNQIDQVRDDIKELEKMIKWEITQLQYGDVVGRIKSGLEACVKIGTATGKDEKMRYQERLKAVCANRNVTIALKALLNGMAGQEPFQKSILDEYYNETKGDREKLSSLAIRLLQLVCGGMMVVATYETVMCGKEAAKEVTKSYDCQLKEVNAKIQSVIDRCMKNFRENMLSDLNTFLDKGGSKDGFVTEIKDFMSDKYDWLENFCLVYNNLLRLDQHCIGGNAAVCSLHRNGKYGIVFYRMKSESRRFSDRYDEAYEIVDEVGCGNAREVYTNIIAKIDERGIGWTGCAVISRGPDLWSDGTFSTKVVYVSAQSTTAILLLQ